MYFQKSCDSSFVKMSSKTIIELAKKTLVSINVYRQGELEKLINKEREDLFKYREKRKNSFWSKLFGYIESPMPTEAEILKNIEYRDEGNWFSEVFWIDSRYSKNEDVAYRLINAAKYTDEIYVSTEDLESLI